MCDLRVADETAIFGVFCRRWGVPLLDGGTVRLPHLIGLSRALDMILTGRPVEAREALAFGLANRVVPAGRAREEAEALARTIAAFPPRCVRSDRRSAWEGVGLSLPAALAHEFALGKATHDLRAEYDEVADQLKHAGDDESAKRVRDERDRVLAATTRPALEGRAWVEDRLGGGATFRVVISAAEPPEVEMALGAGPPPAYRG